MAKKPVSALLILLLLLLSPEISFTEDIMDDPEWQPKVALVLSGGAALGMAHIGVLRVIEEIGIPVDLVVGNSMGALVGGLYAAGYSPGDIYNVSEKINWNAVFLDLNQSNVTTVLGTEQDILNFNLDDTGIYQDEGIIDDQRICSLLSRLTYRVSMVRDFNLLEIPFRTVAVDLRTGDEIEMKEGILAESMRASMGLPVVFDPIEAYGGYLIDGGVLNNLPVNLALKEGADIIISVNVENLPELKQGEIKNSMDVADQTMRIVFNINSHLDETAASDISIVPDLEGLTRFDFQRFDELSARGELAARGHYGELMALAEEIEKYRPLEPRDPDRQGRYFSIDETPYRFLFFDYRGMEIPADTTIFDIIDPEELSLTEIETLVYSFNRDEDYRSLFYYLDPDSSQEFYNLKIVGTPSEQGNHKLSMGIHFDSHTGSETELTGDGYLDLRFRDLLIDKSTLDLGLNLYFDSGVDMDLTYAFPFYPNMSLISFLEGKFYLSDIDTISSQSKLENYQNIALGTDIEFNYQEYFKASLGYEIAVEWYNSLGTLSDLQSGTDEEDPIFQFYQLLNFSTFWDIKTKGPFSRLGIEVSTDTSFYIPFDFNGDPIRRAEIDGILYFSPLTDHLLYADLLLGYYRGDIENQWTLYYPGMAGGIPGVIDEDIGGHEVIVAGLGYRIPIEPLSGFLGMDTYLDMVFRMGNSWDEEMDGLEDLLDLRAGLGAGLLFQTPVGKLSADMGISTDQTFLINLRFNVLP